MKAGDELSNGAILLDETVYQTDVVYDVFSGTTATRSIVLALIPGNVEPFVTWDRVARDDGLDSMAMGHYFRSASDAFAEYSRRTERLTHEKANEAAIRERAKNDGEARASWWVNNDWDYNETRRWFEKLNEDGDPVYEDQLPTAPLGGEWADDESWEQIFRDECDLIDRSNVQTHPQYEELQDIYAEVYQDAAREAIVTWLAKRLESFETVD